MPTHLSLVTRPQQQATEELTLDAEVIVLAGRVFHVHVHGADRNALPWTGDGVAWIVCSADGRGIGVEDGIASIRLEINQGVERRVPSAIGPDVVEYAVIVDTVATADGHLSITEHVPGKAEAWPEVMILRVPHPADRIHSRGGDTASV